MYLPYYGLNQPPFSISPDPNFLWLSPKHRQAFSAMKYGILEEKGFLALIGEVGTGKTLLIKNLVKEIGIPAIIVTIPDPDMEPLDFFAFLAEEIRMNKDFRAKGEFLIHFKQFLLEAYGADKKVLLIIDEAQRLNFELLEQIRLLSNIEMTNKKLLNIFFIGQNEFDNMLNDERSKSTRQRIAVRYKLEPLDAGETAQYIEHRLKIAGASRQIFSADAIKEIYDISDGFPRIINIICDNALMVGYGYELETIDKQVISEYKKEMHLPESKESLQRNSDTAKAENDLHAAVSGSEGLSHKSPQMQTEFTQTGGKSKMDEAINPAQPLHKIGQKSPLPPQFRSENHKKSPSYLRSLMILAFLLIVGFAGYFFYESESENSTRWSVQDIAPKTDFKIAKTEPAKIAPKNVDSIKKQPEIKFADVSPLKSVSEDDSDLKETRSEIENQGKSIEKTGDAGDKELVAKNPPEIVKNTDSPKEKDQDETVLKAADEKEAVKALPQTSEPVEIEDKTEPATKQVEKSGAKDSANKERGPAEAMQDKAPATIPDKPAEQVPDEKLIAKAMPSAGDKAEFSKAENNEKLPAETDQNPHSKLEGTGTSADISAEKATDNHIESFYIEEKNEKDSQNASRLQDVSIIDGKILIYFNYDSLELSEQSLETLRLILDIISKHPNSSILIEGYTDAYGNYWYNEKLSQARADAVKNYFNKQGISPVRITAQGKGSENPRGNNNTPEGRQKNRRVEIKIAMEAVESQ